MQDHRAVRRRRAVLGLLVACSLILLTAYFRESAAGGLHAIQRGFLTVVSPVQEGASKALKPFRDLFGWVGDTLDAKSQRDQLRKQVQMWRSQAIADQGAQRRLAELEALFHLDGTHSLNQMGPVTANVTVRNPSVWYETVTIDKGSGARISNGDPVITGDGLVGKVTSTTSDSAIVTLITDHTSGVSAMVPNTGVWGIVQPAAGNPDDLRLEFIRHGSAVRPGQVLVTAGTSTSRLPSHFPPGIPIGRVSKVDSEEVNLYQLVHLRPFAQLQRLDVVQVLTDTRRGTAG